MKQTRQVYFFIAEDKNIMILDICCASDEAAIYSGIFSEGNNYNMIWNRLERAAKDEASNNLLHSQYAIFANDVKNIIDKAVFDIGNGDVKQGIKALHMAAKAMGAFKDIQALFDAISFELCRTADIFYPYVKYLLSKEDRYRLVSLKMKL